LTFHELLLKIKYKFDYCDVVTLTLHFELQTIINTKPHLRFLGKAVRDGLDLAQPS